MIGDLGVWIQDSVDDELWWSDNTFRLFGLEPQAAPINFERFLDFVVPEDRQLILQETEKLVADKNYLYRVHYRLDLDEGQERFFKEEARLEPGFDGGADRIVGIVQDVTEAKLQEQRRIQLEKQLLQAQKMEAIGTMAGGIAHDFNNILSAILGYSELVQDTLGESHPATGNIISIHGAATRAAKLVRQIMTFSRQMKIERKPIDINRVILNAIDLLQRTVPKMVCLETDLSKSAHQVYASAEQIEQVVMNLVVNAVDAMDGRGNVRIGTGNVSVDNHSYKACGQNFSGNYVQISVRDNGIGMDPEIQTRIFDPFFTTKAVGKGTGLGLSTAYGIITGSGGHISCQSEPGAGTEFQVYLPATNLIFTRTSESDFHRAANLSGQELMLVVEDEPDVRTIVDKTLTDSGYRVVLARTGEEALEIFSDRCGEIDGVILDLGMPGMGGLACLPELRRIDPQAKVLISSGYIQYEATNELHDLGAAGMISKPYQREDLLRCVREMLDS